MRERTENNNWPLRATNNPFSLFLLFEEETQVLFIKEAISPEYREFKRQRALTLTLLYQ